MASSSVNVSTESSDSSVGDSRSATSNPVSFLELLRQPKDSDLARKRKTLNLPPKGVKRGKGHAACDPKNISAADD